jgi:hypothetical protein
MVNIRTAAKKNNTSESRKKIVKEAKQLEASANYVANAHFAATRIFSGIIALLSGILTFLSPKDRAIMNLHSGNEYDAWRHKVRLFWYITCNKNLTDKVLLEKLQDLLREKDKIKAYAPQIPIVAYKLAKINAEKIEKVIKKSGK